MPRYKIKDKVKKWKKIKIRKKSLVIKLIFKLWGVSVSEKVDIQPLGCKLGV